MASQVAEAYLTLRAGTDQMAGDLANARNYVLNAVKSLATAAAGGFGVAGGLAVGAVAGFGLLQTAMESAFRAGSSAIESFVGQAAAVEVTEVKIGALLKSTGGAAGYSAEQLDRMAEEMEGVGTSSKYAIQQAQAALLIFQDIKGDQFKEALHLSVDLADRFHGVAGAAEMLGRSLENPQMAMRTLRILGISLTTEERANLTDLANTNKAAADRIIMDKLRAATAGQAEARRGTVTGQGEILASQFQDIAVRIGQFVLPAVHDFMAAVNDGVARVRPALEWFLDLLSTKFGPAWERARAGVARFVKPIQDFFGDGSRIAAWATDLVDKAASAEGAVERTFGALAGFVGGVWDDLKSGAAAAWDAVAGGAVRGFDAAYGAAADFIKQNQELVYWVGAVAAGVGAGAVAWELLSGAAGVAAGLYVSLGVEQVVLTAAAVAWGAVVAAANAVVLVYNVSLAVWQGLLVTASALLVESATGSIAWAAASGIATAATWLWNAALAGLWALLGPAAVLGAATTVAVLAAAFVVVGAVVSGVIVAARAFGGELMQIGSVAAGPLAKLGPMFAAWGDIFRSVFDAFGKGVQGGELGWQLLKAAASLAVAEIAQLFPPLWDFISGGFSVMAKTLPSIFAVEMKRAMDVSEVIIAFSGPFQHNADVVAAKTKKINEDAAAQTAALTNTAGLKIAGLGADLNKGIGDALAKPSDAVKAAQAEVARLRGQIGELPSAADAAAAKAKKAAAAAAAGGAGGEGGADKKDKYAFTGLEDFSKDLQKSILGAGATDLQKPTLDAVKKTAEGVDAVNASVKEATAAIKANGGGFAA